jgi:predicted Fe-Mo cluster-binding NifX family protein
VPAQSVYRIQGLAEDALELARVAVVTDDGTTVSSHFGHATQYAVYEAHSGTIERKEIRPKISHGTGMAGDQNHASLHESMLSNVMDCEALIAGGMGSPMYEAIKAAGIKPFLTEIALADEAVRAYLQGTLDNRVERLHRR